MSASDLRPDVLTRIYLGADPVEFWKGVSRIDFNCPACSKRVKRRALAIKYVRQYFNQAMTGQKWFCEQCGEAEIARLLKIGSKAF